MHKIVQVNILHALYDILIIDQIYQGITVYFRSFFKVI